MTFGPVDVLRREGVCDGLVLAGRERPFRAEFCAAGRCPSVDDVPCEWSDVPSHEALDAIVDAVGEVTGDDAISDERSDG